MTRYFLTGLLFLLPALAVLAQDTGTEAVSEKPREMLYVTDQLRLSLYPKASDRNKALEYLASGDKLGILEIEGQYALVIAPTGTRGWVKRGFLLPQPTSKLLLQVEKKKNESLQEELRKLTNSKVVIDQYERDMDELTKNVERAKAAEEKAKQKVAKMEQSAREKAELEVAIKQASESRSTMPLQALIDTANTYWQYLIPVAMVFLLLGALIAKLAIDARIRRRFHGLKLW